MRKARDDRLSSIVSVSFSTRGRKSQDTKLKAIHNAELPSLSGLFFIYYSRNCCLSTVQRYEVLLN